LDSLSKVSGDEISMLRILKRQRRMSVSKAADFTGFETERCKSAFENLFGKNFVSFESNEYWITSEGEGYLAYSKSFKDPATRIVDSGYRP
jgi:hypothetical protein